MPAERSLDQQLADLWDAVLNLSLPASEQLSILEAIGDRHAVDELALALDDSFWVAGEAFSQDQLSRDELKALEELNACLDAMSGEANRKKWTGDGLANDPAWKTVRQLASAALAKRQVSRIQKASA